MKHLNKFNESTTDTFTYKNVPNPIIDKSKEWIMNNPRLAIRNVEDSDFFEIEVFGGNHKQVADDLYQSLKESGFLNKYPLFSISVNPM